MAGTSTNLSAPRVLRRSMRERRRGRAVISPYFTPSQWKRQRKKDAVVDTLEPHVNLSDDTEQASEQVVTMDAKDQGDIPIRDVVDPSDTMDDGAAVEHIEPVVHMDAAEHTMTVVDPVVPVESIEIDEIVAVVDSLVNETGLLAPPPTSIVDTRQMPGPATVRDLYSSDYEVRCMFIRQLDCYIFLGREWWGRLFGDFESGFLDNTIDGWGLMLLWWRYRTWPRTSQLTVPLRWTVMPIGFVEILKTFKKNTHQHIDFKAKHVVGVECLGDTGVNYELLMGYADGSRAPYPPWWECDRVLIPVHLPKCSHWILLVFDLISLDITGYDSSPRVGQHVERLKLVEELGENLPRYLLAIDYWKHIDEKPLQGDCMELRYHWAEVPVLSGSLGDCGVWVCLHMERVECRLDYPLVGDTHLIAWEYRKRMMDTFFRARFDVQLPPPPLQPPAAT